jgi:methyltransferase (TIGR00027 family)
MEEVLKEFSTLGSVKGSSTMAEIIAMHRFSESRLAEDERICFDPYAVRFVDPEILRAAAEHPEEAKAKSAAIERLLPGLGNSIRARVRYFDDYAESSVRDGIHQLVLPGAGYDTRAYRLGPVKENARVFELDRPETQQIKVRKIAEIFGDLPAHVSYVPIDLSLENLADGLERSKFSPEEKTLFILEGLVMYIPPAAMDVLLERIRGISAAGSRVIFDYYPASVVYGTDESEIAQNIRNFCRAAGEPLLFGPPDGKEIEYLEERQFINTLNITSADYRALYFTGKRCGRPTCDLLSFIHAEVP